MSELEDAVNRMIEEGRDAQRPTLEAVLAVLERAFSDLEIAVRREAAGPDCWIWLDTKSEEGGQPKYYILGRSVMAGAAGHPLFTVRQAFFSRLDTWVTVSQLVIGVDDAAIAHSIALSIANHAGAMAGARWSIAAAAAANGDAAAAIVAVRALMDASNDTLGPLAARATADPREVN